MPRAVSKIPLLNRKQLPTSDNCLTTKPHQKLPITHIGAEDTDTMISQQQLQQSLLPPKHEQHQLQNVLDSNNNEVFSQKDTMKIDSVEGESQLSTLETLKQGSAGTKHKTSYKRRAAAKNSISHSSSASSNIQKKTSKTQELESSESLPKSKPRRKLVGKLKSESKLVSQETSSGDTETAVMEASKLKQFNSTTKSQWSHIVKKSQIHRHQLQRNRVRPLKKKEFSKRRKSEYSIENTWLPREPVDANTVSQKTSTPKKIKSISKGKSNKLKESKLSLASPDLNEGIDTDDIHITDKPILSEENVMIELKISSSKSDKRQGVNHITNQGKDFKSEPLPAKDSDQTTKTQATYSSPKPSSYHKLSSSPKSHNRDRGTTHINQINVADFAKLNVKVTKPTEPSPPNHNITDYQYRVSMVKFKGASNSVPNYNEKQENIKKTVAQNDALLSNTSKVRKKDVKSMKVSRIEPIPPDRASLLVPTALPHGNKFMNLLIDDRKWDQMSNSSKSTLESTLPRLHYDSPTPFQRQGNGDDEMAGEISIAVPQLPHLIANNRTTRQPSGSKKQTENNLETSNEQHVDTNLHIEEEPTVIITNEGGTHVNKEVADGTRDGWESGYQSITPRLSVDSRSHAMMPGAALHLDIPTEHRSMTPFSSITLSTYIDQSRPSSTHLDVPSNGVDNSDSYSRKISLETRSSVSKLPAIHSRNDNYESMDDRTLYFTPLTIQSIRTPDPEISDENE